MRQVSDMQRINKISALKKLRNGQAAPLKNGIASKL